MDKELNLNVPQTLADLEIVHETKGRKIITESLRALKDKLKGNLVRIEIKDEEGEFIGGPSFTITLDGPKSEVSQFLHTELAKKLAPLGYVTDRISLSKSQYKLCDNTPLAKNKPLNILTFGDIRDIKTSSGSDLFTAEVAAKAILGLKEDKEDAKSALNAIRNGTYYRDLGVGSLTRGEEAYKFESALYMLHQLLQSKGM